MVSLEDGIMPDSTQQVTGHQPVEPDKGPVPTPKEESGRFGLPHQKHHDPEDPGFDDAD
jgi:hypothetical protein